MAEPKEQLERKLAVLANRIQDVDLENELCRATFEGERRRGGDGGEALTSRMNQLFHMRQVFHAQGNVLVGRLRALESKS